MPELRDITVNKVWNDNDDQDGVRPSTISVTLYNGDTAIETKELTEQNGWTAVFTNVPKFQAGQVGQIITYRASEKEVPGDYQQSGGTMEVDNNGNASITITNTRETDKISITVTKKWEDANNQDGIRPDGIEVQLYANNVAYGDVVTLNETNSWKYTYTDLEKNESGEAINYVIKEIETDVVTGQDGVGTYSYEVTGSIESGFTITNTHTPDTTSVSVEKIWDDKENQDGIRPSNITVELLADEKSLSPKKVVILSEDNDWKYTFADLDKNASGEEISYSIQEIETDVITGEDTDTTYSYTITGSQKDGYIITNTHTPIEIELDVEKIWDDNNNQDGKRSKSITVELYADGEKTDKTLTLSDDNDWKDSFVKLPKNTNGEEIIYSVNEITVEDYEVTISPITDGKITITNKHTPSKIKITGEKIWIDSDNQDGKRPETITVHLLANGEEIASKTVNGTGNNWTYEFTDLPEYKDGSKINYTVTEDAVEYYKTDISGFTIKNTHENEQIEISGTKTWDDADNQDGKRPESITVNLLADGVQIDSKMVTEADNWSYSFGMRDKYKAGVIINYTITENAVSDYDTDVVNYNVTNTHTPEKISISGTKTWDDADNQDGKRPESITIILKADGNEVKRTTTTEADEWSYSFSDLPKYEVGKVGHELTYTVEEVGVDGYTTAIDNYDIINTHTPETLTFTVTKIWNDYNNNDGIRPESITVRLKANGEEIKTYTITEANEWTYTFTDLPRYSNGVEIVYTIEEDEVEGYETTIPENVETLTENETKVINNTITNTHEKEKIKIEGQKTWDDFDNKYNSRPDEITIYLYKKDELYETIVVSSETDWKYVIENLDKYCDGEEITWTIKEKEVEGYETIYDGYNILNKIIWEVGDAELPPQTGYEISFNGILYVILSGVLYLLGRSLKHEE